MKKIIEKIFGAKIIPPKSYKIPLVASNGTPTGLFCEFVENDDIYRKIHITYGEIPPIIYITSLDK